MSYSTILHVPKQGPVEQVEVSPGVIRYCVVKSEAGS